MTTDDHVARKRVAAEGLQLCGARNRQGESCGNYPAKGRTRCRFHGGASTGPRTREGLVKAGANLRTHGFYSRLLPAAPDAQLYDEASGEASVAAELKLRNRPARAVLTSPEFAAAPCAVSQPASTYRRQ